MSLAKKANTETLNKLSALATLLSSLRDDNSKKSGPGSDATTTTSENDETETRQCHLSHWRTLPDDVATAYQMMQDGAQLIKASSTKYTLVGKINPDDGVAINNDFEKGAETLTTAILILHDPVTGCGSSTRHYAREAGHGVLNALVALINDFLNDESADHETATVKTGALWEMCDIVGKVPKGNRNAIRRDLFLWVGECQETFEEFKALLDLGVLAVGNESGGDFAWDDFCAGVTEDQYTEKEIEVAKASVALVKCSRGTMNVVLKACECVGAQVSSSDDNDKKQVLLNWINELFERAKRVGDGVTDLGVMLYPPLALDVTEGCDPLSNELLAQVTLQKDSLLNVHQHILDHDDAGFIEMSEDVTEMCGKLRCATQKRFHEVMAAISKAHTI
eukprot:CAMPEP_0172514552 /NCGR_PEP_ID=MMETSP1066-20121228/260909_1 /TAXON_ID=671091 /ORGANISM="Coscinodiscus wailesii, Strain CCMP2513" /LENGTH=392 /DNA_ID=CAMNT_0013295255 /DNA_START=48 /DNA_END=1226 /DNA_ORIENTATION=-